MSNIWAACPLQPIGPTSTRQKTFFTPVNLSLLQFTHDIQVPMNPMCAKTLKLTIQTNYTLVANGDHGTEGAKTHSRILQLQWNSW